MTPNQENVRVKKSAALMSNELKNAKLLNPQGITCAKKDAFQNPANLCNNRQNENFQTIYKICHFK